MPPGRYGISPLFFQAQRTFEYAAWQALTLVATRVVVVWVYDNTRRSVLATVVFHAMMNASWQLFPVDGSYYDPRVTFVIVATAAALIARGMSVTVRPRSFAGAGRS